jgi:hypothetical protein
MNPDSLNIRIDPPLQTATWRRTALCRIAMPVLLLIPPGCQTTRPDFAARSRQDCERGDQAACQMLDAMDPSQTAKPSPSHRKQPAQPTKVQLDVRAIIKGIEQARLARKAGSQENLPTSQPP